MAKLRENTASNDVNLTAWGRTRRIVTRRVDASGRLVLGFALFYGTWLVLAYAADLFAPSEAVSMLAAIAFYFGVIFAVFTFGLGVLLAALDTISDTRRRMG